MKTISTPGDAPDLPELWTRQVVLKFFGGIRPIHTGTLYRGMSAGRYPPPIHISGNSVRWVADECRAALQRMIDERDQPKPSKKKRGRQPLRRIEDN